MVSNLQADEERGKVLDSFLKEFEQNRKGWLKPFFLYFIVCVFFLGSKFGFFFFFLVLAGSLIDVLEKLSGLLPSKVSFFSSFWHI